jgi:GT2 family glycosyltransferase
MYSANPNEDMTIDRQAPLVSVVLLNWNGDNEVIGCIEHVLAQTYQPIELVVVDNASTDGSREAMRLRCPDLMLIENVENLGYATAMNQGIEQASGEFVLLLNQDAWIRSDFVENALQLMANLPRSVGMLAGQIYSLVNHQKTSDLVGGGNLLRKRFQLMGDPDSISGHYTLSPVYCSPFMRKAMLQDLKGICGHYFDDRYFAFGEDLDLTLRAQLRGWQCFFSPRLVTWHTHSGSLGGKVRLWEKPQNIRQHALRNRYTTILKDLPSGVLLYLAPFLLVTEIATWPYFMVLSPSTILCLIRAFIEMLSQLPSTLRLRRLVQGTKVVSSRYLLQFYRNL